MIINHNLMAMNTHRQLGINQTNASKSMERLSSGMRINRAGDDAAGLAISEKMRGQIRGLKQAARNAQDGISLIQTAEGALNETHSILQRMRELATQASSDTNVDVDRGEIQKEINALTSELNRIGNTTEFNTQGLLKGGAVGAPSTPGTPAEAAGDVSLGGLTFSFSEGAALNGYKFILGTVADGTAAGATVDTSTQTITINGDFSNDDSSGTFVSANDIQTAVNTALSGEGIGITVTVTGTAEVTGTGTESDQIAGGVDEEAGSGSGSSSGNFTATFQVGANAGQSMTIDIRDMRATSDALKVAADATGTTVTSKSGKVAYYTDATDVTNGTDNNGQYKALDVSDHDKASAAIDVINDAIEQVSAERSKLGAYQNRLEHTIANLGTSAENLQAAESRIRDLDMAEEIMAFTKNNILQQAATAMLAQANMAPQSVLQLLG
jgi:flagellin